MLRELRAANASPMTLDGTRTWLVGRAELAIIDPGPALEGHVAAIERAAADAASVAILLTHDHPDHAESAEWLASRRGAAVLAMAKGTLRDGQQIPTDAGPLTAVHTPGHTPDHVVFHWPARAAVFVGDLMMGGQDTALVAPPEGDLGDYLVSLERVRSLRARILYPAHGDPITDPPAAIDRYVLHRMNRLAQVLVALDTGPFTEEEVAELVYGGTIPDALRGAALGATRAYLDYLERGGQVKKEATRWRKVDH